MKGLCFTVVGLWFWRNNHRDRRWNKLMFFWPCIMNWLYTNYQLWCTDYYLSIKYYSPLHVSSLKCSSSGGYNCKHAAYGTVTLYESSWWPVGTHLEWELTVGGRLSVGLLWTSDQPVAETSTWQHTTLTTEKPPCPRWDSNPQSQQANGRRRKP